MLKKFLKSKTFGLDLSSTLIRVAQLPNKFGKGKTIEQALKKANIQTKNAHIGLAEKDCFIRLIPKNGNAKKIKQEIEANIPLELNKIYYDWRETEFGLFVAAAKRKIVDEQITNLKKTGIIIHTIEPESIATARALIKTPDSILIIKIASDNQANFIICSNKIVQFTAVGSIKQIPDYLDFYQANNKPIHKILVCGNGDLNKIANNLESLKLPIQISKTPVYATAIGLALKENHDQN